MNKNILLNTALTVIALIGLGCSDRENGQPTPKTEVPTPKTEVPTPKTEVPAAKTEGPAPKIDEPLVKAISNATEDPEKVPSPELTREVTDAAAHPQSDEYILQGFYDAENLSSPVKKTSPWIWVFRPDGYVCVYGFMGSTTASLNDGTYRIKKSEGDNYEIVCAGDIPTNGAGVLTIIADPGGSKPKGFSIAVKGVTYEFSGTNGAEFQTILQGVTGTLDWRGTRPKENWKVIEKGLFNDFQRK